MNMKPLLLSLFCSAFFLPVQASEHHHDHDDHHHHHEHHGHEPYHQQTEQRPHVHGVAHLEWVLQGNQLLLELHSPAYNLTGFGHPAKNAQQQKQIDQQMAALKKGLIEINPQANCQLNSVEIDNPWRTLKAKGHRDVSAEYLYTCQHPQKMHALTMKKLFNAWPNLETLSANGVMNRQQHHSELTAKQNRINLP